MGPKVSFLKFKPITFHPITHINFGITTIHLGVLMCHKEQNPCENTWCQCQSDCNTPDSNKHLTTSSIPLAFTPCDCLHIIKKFFFFNYQGVASGFPLLKQESHFMSCSLKKEAAKSNPANRCTDAAGGLQVTTGLQAAYHSSYRYI